MTRGNDPKKQYGIHNSKWQLFRERVKKKKITLEELQLYISEEIGRPLVGEEIEHLYKRLLQDKYVIETGELLPRDGVIVYCEDLDYGRGVITRLLDSGLMLVKFEARELETMCDSKTLTTVHDETKRKLSLIR